MKPIRTLLVDDEPLARQEMRRLLQPFPMIEIAGEAGTACEATDFLNHERLDFLLLDINLPDASGITVAEAALRSVNPPYPYIVAVTAYEEFARRAFDVAIKDYLLKPVEKDRLGVAVGRLLEFIYMVDHGLPEPRNSYVDFLPVFASRNTIQLLPLEDITVIQAEGHYVRIHTDIKSILSSTHSLGQLESMLPSPPFLRVHRGFIANLAKIERINIIGSSRYELFFHDCSLNQIPVARRSISDLRSYLGL